MSPTDSAIRWQPWGRAAFGEARASRKPILLAISAVWSDGCREMDRATYASPGLAEEIAASCIAVRVDADERPDVAERFALGGLPTTAFLTPEGALLGGGTFVDAASLRAILPRVCAAAEIARTAGVAVPAAAVPVDDEALHAMLLSLVDREHGGFGGAPKFPHTAPIAYCLDTCADTGDAALLESATHALDAMGWGGLYDAETGGFYRYCANADWTAPRREKLLTVNASLLGLFARAAEQTGIDRWRARAADVVAFMQRDLRRQDGAWRVCAGVAASRVFSDANGLAVSALLRVARLLDDASLGRDALAAFEHVLLAAYKPGEGVAHFAGGPRGLLLDQAAMASAALDAWDATGTEPYRMMAEELALFAHRAMWDEAGGGFFDRTADADDPDGVAWPLKPFVLNCEMAVLLGRLAEAAADDTFAALARATVEAIAPYAPAQGVDAAAYLIARRAILR